MIRLMYRLVLLSIFLFVHAGLSGQLKLETNEFIFDDAPFKQCHASSVLSLGKGEILAAWFGGEYERHPEVGIWISKRKNESWTAPVKVADGFVNNSFSYPCWNPVLFEINPANIALFYKVGPSPQEWWGEYIMSYDDGKSWTDPVRLPDGILGPVKNKPVILADGTILSPSSIEYQDKWKAHIEISDDGGKNWTKVLIDPDGEYDVIQPSILVHKDSTLQVLCRSKQNRIISSWSDDRGLSWSALEPTEIKNPNSGSDAVTLIDGRHVLVYNPLESGKNWWEGRNVLKIAISDDGLQWADIYTLENEESGEFSYPAIIQARDGSVHITYTYDRRKIKYIKFNLE